MRTNFISLGRSAPASHRLPRQSWLPISPVNTDSGQWERGMLWYFDTFGEWRLGLSIHNKELGLHTHLDQRAHSSSKTPLPCSPLSFYLYSEGDKHYINTEIVKIISRCESRNESYIRNEGDTHSCPSVCVLFIFVSRFVAWFPAVWSDRDRIVCLMRISAQWIWKEDMTVKFDLSLNIQILCATIETSRVEWRGKMELKMFILSLSLNGRPCHKMKPSLLAASRNPISFNHLWNQNPKYGW